MSKAVVSNQPRIVTVEAVMPAQVTVEAVTPAEIVVTSQGTQGPAWIIGDLQEWEEGKEFIKANAVYHNGSAYRCIAAHTAEPENEPGAGADWQDFWQQFSRDGKETVPIELIEPFARGQIMRFDGTNFINFDPSGWTVVEIEDGKATVDVDKGDKFLLVLDEDCELQVPVNSAGGPLAGVPFVLRIVADGTHQLTYAAPDGGKQWLGETPAVLTGAGDQTVLAGMMIDASPTTAVLNHVKLIPAS